MIKKTLIILALLTIAGCGGGMYTADNTELKQDVDTSYSTPWGNVTIVKNAFILGSDYPAEIVIPDIEGMRSTAFVVSTMSPSGVLAIDLETNPLELSNKFTGLVSPDGTGVPNRLLLLSRTRAFLLTSTHLIDFNPTTGNVIGSTQLVGPVTLASSMPLSSSYDVDNDGTKESSIKTFEMSFPGGLAYAENKLYVSMSNYISPIQPAVAAPGLIRVFDVYNNPPSISEGKTPVVTTDYNPAALTTLPNGLIAVTNSGVADIWDAISHPLTNSSIDFLDPETDTIIGNASIGKAALSYSGIAVTSNGSLGFVGSASFGEMYAVDTNNMTALYTHNNPITITGNIEGSDYLSSQALSYDDWYLFVASFDNSSIYPVDVRAGTPTLFPEAFQDPFVLGFPKGISDDNPTGVNTGVGDVAIRPGIPGVDFTGPDIFALTGSPGTIVTIKTHGTDETNELQINNMEIIPNVINLNDPDGTIQLYLKIELTDGTILDNIKNTFFNPSTGYPVAVSWSSTSPSVASVDNNARLSLKTYGETTIKAAIGKRSASATLVIEPSVGVGGETAIPGGEDETDSENSGSGGENTPGVGGYFPPTVYINPRIESMFDYITFTYQLSPHILEIISGIQIDKDPNNGPEILTEAPAGTDPFADEVTEFNPGSSAGFGQNNMPDVVLGPPQGSASGSGGMDVLSLGDGGEIILEMRDFIIADGNGPDFTVFENAFFIAGNPNKPFSEPAIVSVSEDGVTFYEFNCDLDDNPLFPGCAGTYPTYSNPENGIDPTDPNVSGGNQFDLADVGLTTARYVKITDDGKAAGVSGGVSAGFDLDAIAVINGVLPQ